MESVSDSGPLIHLSSVGLLDLMPQMLTSVYAPLGVFQEVTRGIGLPGADEVRRASWLKVESAPICRDTGLLDRIAHLDSGEQQAILLAIHRNAGLLLADDQEAVRAARSLGMRVTGTVGLLLEAKSEGMVDQLAPVLLGLVDAGFWLSRGFMQRVLAQVGEELPERG